MSAHITQTLDPQQREGAVPGREAPHGQHPGSHRPKKVKRISKACDFCHHRSIRCAASADDPSRCQSCVDYDQACAYDRPTKKRGAKSGKVKAGSPITPDLPESTGSQEASGPASRSETVQTPTFANHHLICSLVDVYFEVIYPILPIFHRPTLIQKVHSQDYNRQKPFYAAVMGVCALASARVRDGALYSTNWDQEVLSPTSTSSFFSAAAEAIPHDPDANSADIDWLRAAALLTVAALQNGQPRKMQHFLGVYNTLVRSDGLHDEKNWKVPMTILEREERRRLFWAMYNFEVYAAAIWGSVVSCREAQSNVHYPAEVDDDFLSRAGEEDVNRNRTQSESEMSLAYTLNNMGGVNGPVSWLQGWNFSTDLYRVLEHAIDGFRKRSPTTDHTKFVAEVWKMQLPQQSNVLEAMMHKYHALPPRFKQTLPVSMDQTQDRFSFQAANIAATMELVRMTLITSAEATAEDRCRVLHELIHTFANVPVAYLRAMSVPILHHLAGIGTILEQVFEKPICESTYQRVRTVILHLAKLLDSLETGMGYPGASARLHAQVDRMEKHMQTQRSMSSQHRAGYMQQAHQQQYIHGPGPSNMPPIIQQPHGAMAYDPIRGTDPNYQYSFPAEVFHDWSYAFDFVPLQV